MSTTKTSGAGRAVSFPALDGASLAGSIFEPEGPPHAALVISSGTGIPRRFYTRFACAAARRGFAVLTYDYRGIGDSAPDSLQGYTPRYRDIGQQDIPGAIAHMCDRYEGLPLVYLGHSAGGQQFGLAPNADSVRAAVFVAVSTGYWRGMPLGYGLMTWGLFRAYIPLAARLYGYAPAKKINWGENLPTTMAQEWGAWCMEPDYLAAYFDGTGRRATADGAPFGPTHYDSVHAPILAYAFSDDPIATSATVPPMLEMYGSARTETRWVSPQDLGTASIGHLGFFRPKVGGVLWDDALDWLVARTA